MHFVANYTTSLWLEQKKLKPQTSVFSLTKTLLSCCVLGGCPEAAASTGTRNLKILSDEETDQIFEPAKLIFLSKIHYHLTYFQRTKGPLIVTHTALHWLNPRDTTGEKTSPQQTLKIGERERARADKRRKDECRRKKTPADVNELGHFYYHY